MSVFGACREQMVIFFYAKPLTEHNTPTTTSRCSTVQADHAIEDGQRTWRNRPTKRITCQRGSGMGEDDGFEGTNDD